eukprot:1162090-Pelagomonas_calceolata.AAC.3
MELQCETDCLDHLSPIRGLAQGRVEAAQARAMQWECRMCVRNFNANLAAFWVRMQKMRP